MTSKRILWAVNSRDGSPLIVRGVLADVDQTGHVTIGNRTSELVAEVLARDPSPTEVFVVPGIDLAHEVYQLVQAKHAVGVPVRDPFPQDTPERTDSDDDTANKGLVSADTLAIIDKTLRLLFSQSYRYARHLGNSLSAVSMKDLRQSPIGDDLISLGRIAEGRERSDQETVFRKARTVLDLLFRSPGEDTYQVPRSFWDEPLGEMLSQAKLQSINPDDMMSITDAAQHLGVARPTIYRWMDDGTLSLIHDNTSGRYFVLRGDVAQLQETMEPDINRKPVPDGIEHSNLAETD
jgi:excisionase family DNA binding protein